MSFLETVSERLEIVMVVMVVIPLERERGGAGGAWFPALYPPLRAGSISGDLLYLICIYSVCVCARLCVYSRVRERVLH